MNLKITSPVHSHLKKGIWHARLQTHSGFFFFFSVELKSIIDDTLCVIWKVCVIQCQQERGFSVQRAPTRSSGIILLLWLQQPENRTTAQGVAKIYTHEQEHTHLHKCTNMAWGSLGQEGGLRCTWPSAGGHFSTAHPIRGEWWCSREVGCWRPLQSRTCFYQPEPRTQPLPLKKYSANYLGALSHNKTVDCTDPDHCQMRKLQRRFHLCTNTVAFQRQS